MALAGPPFAGIGPRACRPMLPQHPPAIGVQVGAVDVGAGVGTQQQRRTRKVLGCAETRRSGCGRAARSAPRAWRAGRGCARSRWRRGRGCSRSRPGGRTGAPAPAPRCAALPCCRRRRTSSAPGFPPARCRSSAPGPSRAPPSPAPAPAADRACARRFTAICRSSAASLICPNGSDNFDRGVQHQDVDAAERREHVGGEPCAGARLRKIGGERSRTGRAGQRASCAAAPPLPPRRALPRRCRHGAPRRGRRRRRAPARSPGRSRGGRR